MRNIILIIGALALIPMGIFAQGFPSGTGGETLGLEQARELALSHSRSLAGAAMTVQSSELTQKTQFHSLLPSLNLNASAGTTVWNKDGTSTDLITESVTAGVSLEVKETIPLWDGGKYSIQKLINSLTTESARQDLLTEYYGVLSAVDTAYYNVLKAQASLEAAETSLETTALSLSVAEIRRQNSMISEAAYLQALAEKESRENSRNESRRSLSLARLSLKNLLGLETLPDLEADDFGSLEDLVRTLASLGDEELQRLYGELWKDIEGRNPALIKAGINTSKAQQSLKSASAGCSPTLNAGASMGMSYDFVNGGFKLSEGRISLGATIPLDFWATAANVEKNRLSLAQSTLSYQSARENLDVQLQTALVNLVSQAGQVLSSGRALEYAQMNFDRVMELYRLNQNSLSTLFEAELLLRNNRNSLINARYALLSLLSTLRSLGAFESEGDLRALLREGGLR